MSDNMNGDPIKQALKDFVATSNSGKYKSEDELMSKFPELSGYDRSVLKDFVATSNSGKYKSEDELFSKFPEFSSPVKKKDSLEPVGGGDVLGAAKKAAEARVASPSSPQQPKPVGTSVKSAATGLGSALPSPLKSESESGKEIPDFTKVGLEGEDAKTAKVLFENQDKDFVKRMFVSDASIKNADETISTHKMASANIDGKEIVFPTIVNVDGKLVDYSNDIDKAIDYAMANNEFIRFGSQEEASRFAEGGWKKLAQEYKNNPNTQPSIPKDATLASPIQPMSGDEAEVGYIEPPNIERVKTRNEFAGRESQARTALYDIQSGKTPSYVDASVLLELSNKGVFEDENVNDFQRKVQERQKIAVPKIEKLKADYIDNAQAKITEKLKKDPEYVSFNSALQSDIDAYAKSLVSAATTEIEQYSSVVKSQAELDAFYKQKAAEVDGAIKQYTDQKLSETSAQYKIFQEKAIKSLDNDIAIEASKIMESVMPGTEMIERTGLKSNLDEIVNDPNFEILPFDRKADLLKSMYITMGNNLAKKGLGTTENLLALKEQLDFNYLGKFYVNPDNTISAFALKQYAEQQIPEIDKKISELSKLYKDQQAAGNMAGGYYENPETGERMPTGEAMVKFQEAKDNLEKIKELPDDEQSGAFSDFMQGFMSTSAAQKTPFLASLLKVGKVGSLYNSAIAAKQTEADDALLTTEAMLQSYSDQTKDQRSIWYNAGVGTAESVPFMGEFMLTMGVGRGTVKGLEKIAEKKIKDYAESSTRKYLLKPLFETVGTLAQTTANPQQVAANTIERMVPEMQLAMSEDGDRIISEVDRNTGESFDEAFLKGFGKTWTEFFVERAGSALPFYTKGLSSKILPKSPDFVKRAFISFYMRKTGSNIGQAYTKLKNVGWDGLLAEFGEELAVMPMENFITGDYKDPAAGPYSSVLNGIIDPKTGNVDVDNLKTIAISVSAMTLPMIGGGMVVNSMPGAKTNVELFDINGNAYRASIRNDIFRSVIGLYRKDPKALDKWISETMPSLNLGMDETFVVNKLVDALKNKSAQDRMPGTTISDADKKLIDEVEKALNKEQLPKQNEANPSVASPESAVGGGDVEVGAKPKPIDEQSIAASQQWIKELYSLPELTRIQDKSGNIYDIKNSRIRKLTLDKEGNVIDTEIIHADKSIHKGTYSNPEFFNEGYKVLPQQPLKVTPQSEPSVASPENVEEIVVGEATLPIEKTEPSVTSTDNIKPIINEQSVITNTTLAGLTEMENTIGGDNEIRTLDTDPRSSEDFTYINYEGEKTTDKKHYRTSGSKYRVFKGKNGKQYIQVAVASSDAIGREGGASVIFEMTGDMTPEIEQAIFNLKASDYKDGNVIRREGVSKFKNDLINIFKGEATLPVQENAPDVASPVNSAPPVVEQTTVDDGGVTAPVVSPVADEVNVVAPDATAPVQEVIEPVTEAAPRVASPLRETKLQKRVREARERIQAKKTASEKKAELETIRAERAESRAKKEQISKLRTRTPKNVTEGVLRYFADGGKIGEAAFRKEVMDSHTEVGKRKDEVKKRKGVFTSVRLGGIIANEKDISENPNTDFNDLNTISMRIAEDMQVPAEIYDETVDEIMGELIIMSLSIQSRNDAEASLTESYERELMQAEMSKAEFDEYEAEQKFLKGEARLDDYYSEAELTAMAQEAEIARKKFESEDFGVKPTQRDAILEKRNEIKSRIKEKSRGRINAIPVDLLADYVELAMTYVQEGFLNTKEFINKFRADNADIISDEVTDDDLAILHNKAMVESGNARVASPIKTEVDEVADEDVPKLGEEREKRVVKRVIEGKSKDFEMLEELASDVAYTSENWADARAKAAKLTAAYKKVYGNDWRKAMYDDIVNGKYTVRDNSAVETFLFDELISASEGTEKAFYVLKFSEKLQGYGRKVSAAYSVYLKSEEGLYQFELSQAADPFKSRLARNKGKVQRDVNEANKKLKKSKKEAIDSAAQSVSENLFGERVASPKQRRDRGRAKVQSAKNKMRSIIMNSSSSFDVMNEWKKGGDFAKSLVEMAEGYVDIGIADAQALVQKIKEELSELGISGDSFEQIRDEFLKEFNLEARVQERLRVEGADKLARKLANRVKERTVGKNIDPLQLLVDTLFRKAEETMPKRNKNGVRLTAEEKIKMAIEDYAAYKDVWDNSKSEFEQIVSELPISDDAKSDMLAKAKEYMENEIGIPYSDKLAEQSIKDEIKSKEMKLKDILLTANDIQAQTKEDFIAQLTDRLIAKGSLTPESAKKIAEKFEQKYSEIMEREAQSLLNKSFPQRFKTPKRKKTENQRIIEVVKYGVFDGKTVEQKDENGNIVKRDADSLFAEKFGFPDVFSKDIQDQIKTWVEKMVKLPEGSIQRRNVEQQFKNYMAFIQNDNNIFRTLLGMQYGNILFDPGTWINVIRGNMFRSFSELMTIATRKVVFEPNRLKDMKVLIGQLGSGVGIREAKGTIAYGQVRRGVEDARPVFAEIRAKYASNPVSRVYWKTQMLSGRIISMLDALFTEPITDFRYADLILDAINKRNKKLDKSERMSQSEIRELASFILGKREGVVTQAERMAVEEFEKTYGENFPMKGEIGNEFQKRVEELSREIGQKEGERMIGEVFEMYEADFQDLFEEARRVSGEIGMVGNPPGTVGLATALIKTLTGMTMPTEWFGRFMGAIAYSAKFTFDASPLGLITILKNAASKERGLGRGNKFVENLYKQNSVRTEYYGFNGNLEKREAFVRWVGFQMVSVGLVYAALGEYLMSALGGDDDERELVGKNMRDKFFGSDLNGSYWKSRPIFVTGRLFGTKGKNYTKTIEFSKATGVKPYTVYMWGKDMGTYLSDPTLMGTFGFAGVMNDAIMFNDKLDEGDIGVVAQASIDQFYIITQSSPFKNISEVINMAMSKREFSEIDKSKSEKMMMFAMKKLSDEARNTFIPRIFMTAENNTEAILAQAEKNNVEWYQFITKDWPLINNFNGADQKFDHFGDPIQKETTLRSPILIKLVDFKNGVPYSPFLTEVQGGQNAELYQLFYSKNSVAHRFSDKREAKVYTNGGQVVTYEMTPTEFAEFNKEVGKELKAWIINGVSPGGLNVKNWLTTLPGNKVGENSESYVIDVTNKKQKSDKQETTFDKAVSKEKDAIQKRVFAKMFPQFRLKKIN